MPAAGFLVRLFMIQHDCGPGSFFLGRLANDWLGRTLGVLTLTSYDRKAAGLCAEELAKRELAAPGKAAPTGADAAKPQ